MSKITTKFTTVSYKYILQFDDSIDMAKQEVKRVYNITDVGLIQLTDDLLQNATQDAAELSPFGIDQERLDRVRTLRNEFNALDSDKIYRTDLRIATQARNDAREALIKILKDVRLHIKIKLGKDSLIYERFDLGDLYQKNDAELSHSGYSVVRGIDRYVDQLNLPVPASGELSLKEQLLAATEKFDDLIDKQKEAINIRDDATRDRRMKGNELFKEISIIAEAGRDYFSDNDAKYNNYVIYGSEPKREGDYRKVRIEPGQAIVITDNLTDKQLVELKNVGNTELTYELKSNAVAQSGEVLALVLPLDASVDLDGDNATPYLHLSNTTQRAGEIEWSIT